jgi:hypothetical protein
MSRRIPEDEVPLLYRIMAVFGPGGTFLFIVICGFLLFGTGKILDWTKVFIGRLFGN